MKDFKKFKDPLIRFQYSFPFHRILIRVFYDFVMKDKKVYYTNLDLESKFRTPAWKGQFSQGTPLAKLLALLPGS